MNKWVLWLCVCFYLRNSGETITSRATNHDHLPMATFRTKLGSFDHQDLRSLWEVCPKRPALGMVKASICYPISEGPSLPRNCQARSHLELAEPSQIPQAEADKVVVPSMGLFRSEGQKLEVLSDTTWYVKFTSSIDRCNFLFILNFSIFTHTLCMLRTFRWGRWRLWRWCLESMKELRELLFELLDPKG